MSRAAGPAELIGDRGLLMGLLAYQERIIDRQQLAAACAAWANPPEISLPEYLVAQGWLTAAGREILEMRLSSAATAALSTGADLGTRPYLNASIEPMPGNPVSSNVWLLPADAGERRFTVVRPHAQGGLGRVSVARDERLGRQVALKEIRPDRRGDPRLRQRFLKEAAITGRLEHPGIVPVYALENGDGEPYYVMRFVEGKTLGEAIADYHRKPAPLGLRELLKRYVAVCQTLAYAHGQGVIHRDLKPSNIMLGEFGETLVLDWGLARPVHAKEENDEMHSENSDSAGTDLTAAGQVLGTPAFMSPEQAAGHSEQVGPATDIYALGAILYSLLTVKAPYEGTSVKDVLQRLRAGPPPRPSAVRRNVPPSLEAIVLKAMARSIPDRYVNAAELASDVERWLADEPIRARRDPWATRAWRFARKHRPLVAGTAALLGTAFLAMAVGLPYSLNLQAQTAKARDDEHGARIREGQQRDEAIENFADARAAVDLMLSELGHTQLAGIPQMEPVRRRLLEKALTFYQKFSQKKSADPTLRQDVALAFVRVGAIRYWLGQYELAADAHREAVQRLQELSAIFPEEPLHRHNLAAAWQGLADDLAVLNRGAESGEAFKKAVEIHELLVAEHPESADFRRGLAANLNQLANVATGRDPNDTVELMRRRILQLNEDLASSSSATLSDRVEVTKSRGNLANILRVRGQDDEAEKLYRQNLDAQEKLRTEFPTDPEVRYALTNTLRNLGDLCRLTKRPDEAEKLYHRAADLFERLAAEFPIAPWYREGLAETHLKLGDLLQEGRRLPEAEQALRAAIPLLQKVVAESASVPDFRFRLAYAHLQLAELKRQTQQLSDAVIEYRECLAAVQSIVDSHPHVAAYRQMLTGTTNNLALVLIAQGKPAEAVPLLRTTIEHGQKLTEQLPSDQRIRHGLAGTFTNLSNIEAQAGHWPEAEQARRSALTQWRELMNQNPGAIESALEHEECAITLGNMIRDRGRRDEASKIYSEVISTLEPIAAKEPKHVQVRQVLGTVYWVQADVHALLGRHASAVPYWDKAIDLDAGESRSLLRLFRALSLARSGRHADAAVQADALAREAAVKPETLFDLSRVFVVASQAAKGDAAKVESYQQRAVSLLGQAGKAGYFKTAGRLTRLNQDKDLAPLRERADFRQLVAELEKE